MRNWRYWAMQAVLLLGLGTVVAQAADREDRDRYPKPPTEPESKWGWMNPATWFGGKEKEKLADAKGKKVAKKEDGKSDTPPAPSAADEARARRNREEADLIRRWAVCDQLREIALRNEDHAMLRRVEALTERAYAIYSQRTGAGLPTGGAGLDAELRALNGGRESEGVSRRRAADEPVYDITSGSDSRRAGVKEVNR